MAKNDFDIDFDFEKEYGFDPESYLDSADPGDFDLSQLDELGLDIDESQDAVADDQNSALDHDMEEDFASDFPRHAVTDETVQYNPDAVRGQEDSEFREEPESLEQTEYDGDESFLDETIEEGDYEEKKKISLKMPHINLPKINLPKLPERDKSKPTVFEKIYNLYIAPVVNPQEYIEQNTQTANGTRRKRRPTKMRIFKEVYLPLIISVVAILLLVCFVAGSVSNAVQLKKISNEKEKVEKEQAAQQASEAGEAFGELLRQVDEMTIGYDYDGAIALLDSYTGDNADYQQQVTAKRAELVNTKSTLMKWDDLDGIANLSFHVLINDPVRAFSNAELGGLYNRNFVTVEEFGRILEQLYSGGYVLVDFNSFVTSVSGIDGTSSIQAVDINLPAGKKPIMLTETMVNYFDYMIDSNKDGTPDAGGDGFAAKLVVDLNGDIKAEYVDASGNTLIGDYDFVPVLEAFIKAHPDFSYRGARATLAVTGTQGVFGYRTNTSYVATMGQDYYNNEVSEAQNLVQVLRDKGYTIASYTYSNAAYRDLNANQIKSELENWKAQITPVIGDVDTIVFARSSDIEDYSGNKFTVLYEAGYRYFVSNGTASKIDVNTTYVYQKRLMVTGENMGWSTTMFSQYFDSNMVLDMSNRKSIPH